MNLGEELLLLALRDNKGTVRSTVSLVIEQGLAGALLIELMFAGKVLVRDKKLYVADSDATGDELLDTALSHIGNSKRERGAKYWVKKLDSRMMENRETIADRLVERGILVRKSGRRLLIVPTTRYKSIDGSAKLKLRKKIHTAVLGGRTPDQHLAALICLVQVCELSREVFPKHEQRVAEEGMKEISSSGAVGEVVVEAIDGIKKAITLDPSTAYITPTP